MSYGLRFSRIPRRRGVNEPDRSEKHYVNLQVNAVYLNWKVNPKNLLRFAEDKFDSALFSAGFTYLNERFRLSVGKHIVEYVASADI